MILFVPALNPSTIYIRGENSVNSDVISSLPCVFESFLTEVKVKETLLLEKRMTETFMSMTDNAIALERKDQTSLSKLLDEESERIKWFFIGKKLYEKKLEDIRLAKIHKIKLDLENKSFILL